MNERLNKDEKNSIHGYGTISRMVDDFYPIIIYFSISLLIVSNFEKYFALDTILPVKNHLRDFYFSMNLLYPIMELTSSWLAQRIYLLLIIFISGYSAYDLFSKISQSKIAKFYAGLLYIVNPYMYIRMIVGHWFVIISYATLPFLLKVFIDVIEKKEEKEIIKFIFLLSIVALSFHVLIISFIIMIAIFLFWFNKHRYIRISKIIVLSILLFVLLNSYWIVPAMTAKNTVIDDIGEKDFDVFAPKGSLFEIATMYGFWREGYIYTKDILPGWQIFYLIILSLSIIGFLAYYKDEKIGYIIKTMATIGILGFILASGIKGPFGDQIYWLFDNTILKGFRDSHKFVGMIALSYSILGGLGIAKLENIQNYQRLGI